MQLRAVGRAVLVAAAPRLALRMLVEAVDAVPRRAAVLRAEQSLRRRARVPDARLRRVARRQPERVIDDAAAALARTPAAWSPPSRSCRDRSSETPSGRGARCARRRAASCRRADRQRVMDDVAEEMRPGELPRAARGIARRASTGPCASRSSKRARGARRRRELRHGVAGIDDAADLRAGSYRTLRRRCDARRKRRLRASRYNLRSAAILCAVRDSSHAHSHRRHP